VHGRAAQRHPAKKYCAGGLALVLRVRGLLVWLILASAVAVQARPSAVGNEAAVDEMLRGPKGVLQYWSAPPELVVLTTVMDYRGSGGADSVATAELLADEDADLLIADLTDALRALTDGRYARFASVRREAVPVGVRASISRPRQIVVGRYSGLQRESGRIGLGGRTALGDGRITAGAVLVDSDYDRTSGLRRLLRTHELGHALGYNHVQTEASIMNPSIGSEVTAFDRAAIRLAFDRVRSVRAAN
jgi:hypothetical protein